MKTYVIKKMQHTNNVWDSVEQADIDIYRWKKDGYRPKSFAQMFCDNENLYIKFTVFEKRIKADYKNHNEKSYEDSCVEIFIRPKNQKNYINIETNAIGKMLMEIGEKRGVDRKKIWTNRAVFDIKNSAKDAQTYCDDKWIIEFKIPFDIFKEHYQDFNINNGFEGNLYKCEDVGEFQHFGVWNEVQTSVPDYHRPEYFGVFEIK